MNLSADIDAILERLSRAGITLTVTPNGDKLHLSPKTALTEELIAEVRANKPALLAALGGPGQPGRQSDATSPIPEQPIPPATTEAQRRVCEELLRRVQAKLVELPEIDLEVIADEELEPGSVLIAVARRDRFACVLRVDTTRYDGVRLLSLIEQHTLH